MLFLGTDTFLFYFQVKDELGSGFSFDKGPLFDINEELIKQLCIENPESAPARIALMVPCFEKKTMEMKKSISINGLSGFWIISGNEKM